MALSPTSSRAAAAAAASTTLLSTTTIAGAPAIFDITGIAQTYNDLLIVLIGRAAIVAANDSILFRLNGVSAAQYATSQINGVGGAVSGFQQNTDSKITPQNVPAASATAGYFGYTEFYIPGYASTTWVKQVFIKAILPVSLATGGLTASVMAGLWNQTAAVNRVTLSINDTTTTFDIGSVLRVYGIS